MYAKHFAALTGLMALLAFTNTGCFTLIGAGIGSIDDGSKPDRFHTGPGWQVEKLKPGTPVVLSLPDSVRMNGKYLGVEQQSAGVYAQRYTAERAQPEGAALPPLGDTITLVRSSGKQETFAFQGFDYEPGSVPDKPKLLMVVKRNGHPELKTVKLEKAKQLVDSKGMALTAGDLNRRFLEGQLPLLSSLVLVAQQDTVRIATDQVVSMTTPVKKRGARIGAQIGGSIDAAILVVSGIVVLAMGGLYWLSGASD